ncbi:MAG: YceD family protein [Cyanobacteria bacterium P01_G01_bin.54]
MRPLYIPQIRQATDARIALEVEETIPGLETLTPVRGQMTVAHHLSYLDVTATVETIATLVCHRCLKHYNHRLRVETQELIWLDDPEPDAEERTDLHNGDFSETLSPQGYFDPTNWLYEQLSLAMPLQQICGDSCEGIAAHLTQTDPQLDSRWAGLSALRQQLDRNEEMTQETHG